MSLLSSSIDEKERGKAIGTWSAVTTVVTMGGPILGGALADAGLWRYIFFINVPIGIVVLLILAKKVAADAGSVDPGGKGSGGASSSGEVSGGTASGRMNISGSVSGGRRVDWLGAAAIALGLAAMTFGFLRTANVGPGGRSAAGGSAELGFGTFAVWGSLLLGVLLLGLFLFIEARSRQPMMPLFLFANRTFSAVNALTFFLYAGLGAGMLFLSLNLVQAQGYSQFESGLTFLPFTVLMISLARWAGTMADKHGAKWFLTAGPAAAGVGLLMLSFVGQTRGPGDYWTSFLPGVLVLGLGMAFTVAPLTTTVMRSASDEYSGVASGINNAMTRIASVFANAIFGALAVLLFAGMIRSRIGGLELTPTQRQGVLAQAGNLGNAGLSKAVWGEGPEEGPEKAAAKTKAMETVRRAYREGFIGVYGDVLKMAAGLAFLGALMGVFFVPGRRRGVAGGRRSVRGSGEVGQNTTSR